jgi:diguanylate cyclase (GGDEF)-like protein/PAS domain S-box-containing protein
MIFHRHQKALTRPLMTDPATAPSAPLRQAAILIVDDAPASLEVLGSMLRQQGYRTYVANSAERGLDLAQRVQPDLILLDIMMQGIDGLEACRRLKAHPDTARIPVIFMSARSDTDDIVAGFDIGAADYIAKPLRLAEVCARVRAQLQFKRRSESGEQQARRLSTLVNSLDEGLLIVEASGRIQYANPASERYLGYAPSELSGLALADLLAPAVADDYLDHIRSWIDDPASERYRGAREELIRRRDGIPRAMDFSLTPMHAGEPLFVALLHDITHHKQSETALQRAALVDPLTRIANRRHFDTFLEKEWQRAIRSAAPLSLIVLDVDHFKLYNDTLGHAAGDACLRRVAEALQSHALRPTDLAARYGGEEFVLLFAETPAENALHLAEVIRGHIEGLMVPNPRSPTSEWITVSIGVATIVPTKLDVKEQLFIEADRVMYEAKEAGRNQVRAVHAGATWEAVQAAM